MNDPNSVDEWLALAQQHEASARVLARSGRTAAQAFWHVGLAAECALKAYIMRVERLNSWPSKASRKELYTHDLKKLMAIADIVLSPADKTAPAWHVVLQWDRAQGYDPRPTPPRVARSMIEAAFGEDGVVTWLRSQLIPPV